MAVFTRNTNGLTPHAALDAMVAELQELFKGQKFTGPNGQEELNVFSQLYPIQECSDEGYMDDLSLAEALAPSLLVQMEGGEIASANSQPVVTLRPVACVYDGDVNREGFNEVYTITQAIVERFNQDPDFGGTFEARYPLKWAIQQEESVPYYFGAVTIDCALPRLVRSSRNKEVRDLI